MKFRWKPALIPAALTYFLLNVADSMIWPYLNLQMKVLGLNLADITLVSGLIPFLAIFCTPALGYVGDKLGYKLVFMICIVLCMIMPTSFNFLPVYREHLPKIALDSIFNSSGSFEQEALVWFGAYGKEGISCKDSFENVTIKKIECNKQSHDVNFQVEKNKILSMKENDCDTLDTFTCKYIFKDDIKNGTHCSVINDSGDGMAKEGSHTTTFWIYFMLRSIYSISISGLFNIADATGAIIAKREKSSYSIILFCGNIGLTIGPFIVGPLVDKINLGLSTFFDCLTQTEVIPDDYKLPSFIADGIYVLMAIFVLVFLDIVVEKSPKKLSLKEEFAWLKNPAALSFYFYVLLFGINLGAGGAFLFVYTQENLKASVSFISYMQAASVIGGIIILPFGGYIIRKFGHANTFCFSFIILSIRPILWAFPFSSSMPYEFIAYGLIDMFKWLHVAAMVEYTGIIAPARLTATALSLTSGLNWLVGNGFGALIAGGIAEHVGMRFMFIIFGVFFICFGLIYWILYHTVIKKFEPKYSVDKETETSEEENNENKERINLDFQNSIYKN